MIHEFRARIGSTGALLGFTVLVTILATYGFTGLAPRAAAIREFGQKNRRGRRGALRHPGRSPTMRTALIALIVLIRFGPDIVYAANASLPRPDSPRRTSAPKWIGNPPAVVVIRPPSP